MSLYAESEDELDYEECMSERSFDSRASSASTRSKCLIPIALTPLPASHADTVSSPGELINHATSDHRDRQKDGTSVSNGVASPTKRHAPSELESATKRQRLQNSPLQPHSPNQLHHGRSYDTFGSKRPPDRRRDPPDRRPPERARGDRQYDRGPPGRHQGGSGYDRRQDRGMGGNMQPGWSGKDRNQSQPFQPDRHGPPREYHRRLAATFRPPPPTSVYPPMPNGQLMGHHQMGPRQVGPWQIGPGQMQPRLMGPRPMEPDGMGPRQMGPGGMGPRPVGPRQMGPDVLAPRPMGPSSMGPRPVGPGQMGPDGMGPWPVGPGQMRPDGMGPRPMGPGLMGPDRMGPRPMGPGHMGPDGMGPRLMGPGQTDMQSWQGPKWEGPPEAVQELNHLHPVADDPETGEPGRMDYPSAQPLQAARKGHPNSERFASHSDHGRSNISAAPAPVDSRRPPYSSPHSSPARGEHPHASHSRGQQSLSNHVPSGFEKQLDARSKQGVFEAVREDREPAGMPASASRQGRLPVESGKQSPGRSSEPPLSRIPPDLSPLSQPSSAQHSPTYPERVATPLISSDSELFDDELDFQMSADLLDSLTKECGNFLDEVQQKKNNLEKPTASGSCERTDKSPVASPVKDRQEKADNESSSIDAILAESVANMSVASHETTSSFYSFTNEHFVLPNASPKKATAGSVSSRSSIKSTEDRLLDTGDSDSCSSATATDHLLDSDAGSVSGSVGSLGSMVRAVDRFCLNVKVEDNCSITGSVGSVGSVSRRIDQCTLGSRKDEDDISSVTGSVGSIGSVVQKVDRFTLQQDCMSECSSASECSSVGSLGSVVKGVGSCNIGVGSSTAQTQQAPGPDHPSLVGQGESSNPTGSVPTDMDSMLKLTTDGLEDADKEFVQQIESTKKILDEALRSVASILSSRVEKECTIVEKEDRLSISPALNMALQLINQRHTNSQTADTLQDLSCPSAAAESNASTGPKLNNLVCHKDSEERHVPVFHTAINQRTIETSPLEHNSSDWSESPASPTRSVTSEFSDTSDSSMTSVDFTHEPLNLPNTAFPPPNMQTYPRDVTMATPPNLMAPPPIQGLPPLNAPPPLILPPMHTPPPMILPPMNTPPPMILPPMNTPPPVSYPPPMSPIPMTSDLMPGSCPLFAPRPRNIDSATVNDDTRKVIHMQSPSHQELSGFMRLESVNGHSPHMHGPGASEDGQQHQLSHEQALTQHCVNNLFKVPAVPRRAHSKMKKPYNRDKIEQQKEDNKDNLKRLQEKLRHSPNDKTQVAATGQRAGEVVPSCLLEYPLKPALTRALEEKGMDQLTLLQTQCLEDAMCGQNVMMFANHSTGKTLVHILCVLNGIQPMLGEVQAVVVCSIRDHAYKVCNQYKELMTYMPDIDLYSVVGGTGSSKIHKKRFQRKMPDILIGSAGRITKLEEQFQFMKHCRFLVFEEFGHAIAYPYLQRDIQILIDGCGPGMQMFGTTAECKKSHIEQCKSYFPGGLIVFQRGYGFINHNFVEHYYLPCVGPGVLMSHLIKILTTFSFKKALIYMTRPDLAALLARVLCSKDIAAASMLNFTRSDALSLGYSTDIKAMMVDVIKKFKVIICSRVMTFGPFDLIIHLSLPLSFTKFGQRVRHGFDGSPVRSIVLVNNERRAISVNRLFKYLKVRPQKLELG